MDSKQVSPLILSAALTPHSPSPSNENDSTPIMNSHTHVHHPPHQLHTHSHPHSHTISPTDSPFDIPLYFSSITYSACVFITGGSGFIGSVLIELLLRSFPNISISLILRGKRGKSPTDRMVELFHKPLFDPLFEVFIARAKRNGKTTDVTRADVIAELLESRIKIFEGDLIHENLGLAGPDISWIHHHVTHFIHSAASLKFTHPLYEALEYNFFTSKRILELASNSHHCKGLIHISTAYVNGYKPKQSHIKEKIYLDPINAISTTAEFNALLWAEWIKTKLTSESSSDYLKMKELKQFESDVLKHWGFPNTYTLTKWLTEIYFTQQTEYEFPITILRPSMVGCTSELHPVAGYLGNKSGSAGVHLVIGNGIMEFTGNTRSQAIDIVPADAVSSCILAILMGMDQQCIESDWIRIFHLASSGVSPLINSVYVESCEKFYREYPTYFMTKKLGKHKLKHLNIKLNFLLESSLKYQFQYWKYFTRLYLQRKLLKFMCLSKSTMGRSLEYLIGSMEIALNTDYDFGHIFECERIKVYITSLSQSVRMALPALELQLNGVPNWENYMKLMCLGEQIYLSKERNPKLKELQFSIMENQRNNLPHIENFELNVNNNRRGSVFEEKCNEKFIQFEKMSNTPKSSKSKSKSYNNNSNPETRRNSFLGTSGANGGIENEKKESHSENHSNSGSGSNTATASFKNTGSGSIISNGAIIPTIPNSPMLEKAHSHPTTLSNPSLNHPHSHSQSPSRPPFHRQRTNSQAQNHLLPVRNIPVKSIDYHYEENAIVIQNYSYSYYSTHENHNNLNNKVDSQTNSLLSLSGIHFSLRVGEILCLTGPQASGKSTLLNAILNRDDSLSVGWSRGKIFTDSRKSGILECDDTENPLVGQFSIREVCILCAKFHTSKLEQLVEPVEIRVDRLLKVMGIAHHANTHVGSIDHRGLSGGELRRAQISLALSARPKLLILDNAFDGLDSMIADHIILELRTLCRRDGIGLILSMKQPTQRLLSHCDKLLVLSSGHQMFYGSAKMNINKLSLEDIQSGYNNNPDALHSLKLGNSSKDLNEKSPINIYINDDPAQYNNELLRIAKLRHQAPISWFEQYKLLLYEFNIIYLREYRLYYSQMILMLLFSFLIGLLLTPIDYRMENLLLFETVIIWITAACSVVVAFSTFYMKQEMRIFNYYHRQNTYSLTPWFAAQFTSQIIPSMLVVFPCTFVSYLFCTFPLSRFHYWFFTELLCYFIGQNVTAIVCLIFPSVVQSLLVSQASMIASIAFIGGLLKFTHWPSHVMGFTHIDFFHHAGNLLYYGLFHDRTFTCRLDEGGFGFFGDSNQCRIPSHGNFQCSEVTEYVNCIVDGKELLREAYGINTNEFNPGISFLYLILIFLTLKFILFVGIHYHTSLESRVRLLLSQMKSFLVRLKNCTLHHSEAPNPNEGKYDTHWKNRTNSISESEGGLGTMHMSRDRRLSVASFMTDPMPALNSVSAMEVATFQYLRISLVHENPIMNQIIRKVSNLFHPNRVIRHKPRVLLNDISGFVKLGSSLAIFGSSGTGKSTLLKAMAGLLHHSAAEGSFVLPHSSASNHSSIQFVPQEERFVASLTAGETLLFAQKGLQNVTIPTEFDTINEWCSFLFDAFGLNECVDQLMGTLTSGQRRTISLVTALAACPRVLIMDEIFSGMNPKEIDTITKYLFPLCKRLTIASIISVHQPSLKLLTSFDSVMILSDKHQAFFGSMKEFHQFAAKVSEELDYAIATDAQPLPIQKVDLVDPSSAGPAPLHLDFSGETIEIIKPNTEEGEPAVTSSSESDLNSINLPEMPSLSDEKENQTQNQNQLAPVTLHKAKKPSKSVKFNSDDDEDESESLKASTVIVSPKKAKETFRKFSVEKAKVFKPRFLSAESLEKEHRLTSASESLDLNVLFPEVFKIEDRYSPGFPLHFGDVLLDLLCCRASHELRRSIESELNGYYRLLLANCDHESLGAMEGNQLYGIQLQLHLQSELEAQGLNSTKAHMRKSSSSDGKKFLKRSETERIRKKLWHDLSLSPFRRYYLLFYSMLLVHIREIPLFWGKLMTLILSGLWVGNIFPHLPYTTEFVREWVSSINYILLFTMFSTIAIVSPMSEYRHGILQQQRNGRWTAFSFFLSSTILSILSGVVLTLCYTISFYFLVGFQMNGNFFVFFFVLFLVFLCLESLCSVISFLIPSQLLSSFISATFVSVFAVFDGFYLPTASMPRWLLFLSYLSPARFGFEILTYSEFNSQIYTNNATATEAAARSVEGKYVFEVILNNHSDYHYGYDIWALILYSAAIRGLFFISIVWSLNTNNRKQNIIKLILHSMVSLLKFFPIIIFTVGISLLGFYSNNSLNSSSSGELSAPASIMKGDYTSLPQYTTVDIEVRNKSVEFFRNGIYLDERVIGGELIPPSANGSLGLAILQAEYLPQSDYIGYSFKQMTEQGLPKINSRNFTELNDYILLFRDDLKDLAPEPISNKDYLSDQLFAKKSLHSNYIRLTNYNEIQMKIPNYIPLMNDSHVNYLFDSMKSSFSTELMNSRIYMIDHSAGMNLTCQTNRICFGGLALFYINSVRQLLMPLSITLYSGQNNNTIITYFPHDNQFNSTGKQSTFDWTFAKISFNSVDGFYISIRHFLENHLIFEPFRTIIHRQMHESHPISRLLIHHMKNLYGMSHAGFELLFNENNSIFHTAFPQSFKDVMRHLHEVYMEFDWEAVQLEADFDRRQVKNIPGYLYYLDSMKLYKCIKSFVSSYIYSYYLSDNDILLDWELQAVMKELSDSNAVPGFPVKFVNRNEMVRAFSHFVYSLAVQHHSRNTYSFWHLRETLPMSPMSLWKPIPTTKPAVFSELELVNYLPHGINIYWQVALARGFFIPVSPVDSLGSSYAQAGLGMAANSAVQQFRVDMEKISIQIQKRNVIEGPQPYPFSDPQYLPHFPLI